MSAPLRGRKVWVVGASSGIGAELARELVRRGAEVAISGRRAVQLEEVAGGTMTTIPLDITEAQSVDDAAAAVRQGLGGLDTVVHSAGHWKQFNAAAWDRESFARHVEVNLLGLNNVLAAVVPSFVADGRGHIVGVASVAGYRGLPGSEAYGATKAAQLNLLEAMRASLSPKGIRVTTVAPGFVRTEMTSENEFPMPFIIEANEAGRTIADGLERGDENIVFPKRMAVAMVLARLVPGRLWTAATSRRARA
ncbi:MAG TPA: SDR family NAD(P)-dependent oxidoreductase [Intrasporangium sp.]|uniref:SDR family NAD(P)-dependent oxidoreductase n=1 Tax=Intrasporangium sp. TaxID=1925024 RepID=UPI002B49D15C|nr:SDR family NAD(P)-dependent oxidoreductase [Intrasporangium sp.]HKX66157.1 SDR family NAD(P)-dependent oxidoreductase [Intrasporangium sp.]